MSNLRKDLSQVLLSLLHLIRKCPPSFPKATDYSQGYLIPFRP